MQFRHILAPFVLFAVVNALGASFASASLIDNGTTTIDTDTSLEWLDLTETLGLSYADALTTSFVTVDGYRPATSLEVAQLFTNAGMSAQDNLGRVVDHGPATDLLNTLGCTLAPAVCATTANPSGTGFAEWTPGTGRRALYRTDIISGGRGAATIQSSFVTGANASIGTYLVRAVVPEPSTGLLLMGGLICLGGRRRSAAKD